VTVDQAEVALDGALASSGVGAEPGLVSVRAARNTSKIRVGPAGVGLGARGGGADLRLSGRRAADETSPLVVDAGDGEVTRELDLNDVLNSGVEVLGGAVSIDVGELVRWFDGVVSRSGLGEVVSGGD